METGPGKKQLELTGTPLPSNQLPPVRTFSRTAAGFFLFPDRVLHILGEYMKKVQQAFSSPPQAMLTGPTG